MRLAIIVGIICTVVSVQVACAADLGNRTPTYPAAPFPLYRWTGFYVGGNIGYAWNNIDDTTFSSISTGGVQSMISVKDNGVFGGAQVGYNYLLNPNFLIGVEADLDAANLSTNYAEAAQPAEVGQEEAE